MEQYERVSSSRWKLVVFPLLFLIVADIVFFTFAPLQYIFPSSPALPRSGQFEIAAVLFAGFNDTFTGINNETKRRVHYGKTLLENDLIDQLVVVGGGRKKSNRKGARLMADYLRTAGVSQEKILVEASSSDSTSNLQQLYRIMQEQGIDRAGLISSPYHLQRIKHMRILPGVHFFYLPYSPTRCMPPLTRSEIWWSAHYNLAAYVLHLVLPEPVYLRFVDWVRTNTEW